MTTRTTKTWTPKPWKVSTPTTAGGAVSERYATEAEALAAWGRLLEAGFPGATVEHLAEVVGGATPAGVVVLS